MLCARQVCAFYRVWCLVELTTALRDAKPVIMLVGETDEASGDFVPLSSMLRNLLYSLDITNAQATFEEDRVRILGEVATEPGVEAVNSLAKGAVTGARLCMQERAVLKAGLGNGAPLAALSGKLELESALRAAAAAGLNAPLCVPALSQREITFATPTMTRHARARAQADADMRMHV